MRPTTLILTFALWLTLAAPALAKSDAYNAGYVAGRVLPILLIVGLIVFAVSKLRRSNKDG